MESQTHDENSIKLKFCKHCGEKIPADSIICTKCGRQVEELKSHHQNIVINNDNSSKNMNANANVNVNTNHGRPYGNPKKKMTAIFLCIFLGWIGGHKFYEGKPVMGIIYFFTAGLFFIGVIIDLIALLAKPSTYYV